MYTKTLSAIFLIVIVAGVHCEDKDLPPDVEKCLKLNVGEDFDETAIDKLPQKDRKKFLCGVGCLIKGEVGAGKSMQQFFLEDLTKEDEKDPEVAALTEKLRSCGKVGDDPCKFMECLDNSGEAWKSRIDDWVESFVESSD